MGKQYGTKYEVVFNSSWFEHREYSYCVKANSEKKAIRLAKDKLAKEIGDDKSNYFGVKTIMIKEK